MRAACCIAATPVALEGCPHGQPIAPHPAICKMGLAGEGACAGSPCDGEPAALWLAADHRRFYKDHAPLRPCRAKSLPMRCAKGFRTPGLHAASVLPLALVTRFAVVTRRRAACRQAQRGACHWCAPRPAQTPAKLDSPLFCVVCYLNIGLMQKALDLKEATNGGWQCGATWFNRPTD